MEDYTIILKQYGFRTWSGDLLLIPYKYYDQLPMGLELTDINGDKITVTENYKNNKSVDYIDNDYRMGLLAFGVTPDKYRETSEWVIKLNHNLTEV